MSAEQIDEWARQIGFHVVSFVPVCDRMGWGTVGGSRPYMHASSVASGIWIDFLELPFQGLESAPANRLRSIAPEWGVDAASLAQRVTERQAPAV